jgi:primosomal protein N' (replication factor Y)
VVGTKRTVEELTKAFKNTPVIRSDAEQMIRQVDETSAIIVATPGSEPHVTEGYAAAVVLDGDLMTGWGDVHAHERALRHWCRVTALTRPASAGGTVIIVATASDLAVQAMVRLDLTGAAERELADRRQADMPPVVRLAEITGCPAQVELVKTQLVGDQGKLTVECLGPVPSETDPDQAVVYVKVPHTEGEQLARQLHEIRAALTAKNEQSSVWWRLDPIDL